MVIELNIIMKRFLLIATVILSGIFAHAQEGKWKIKINGKTLLYTSIEDEKNNTKKISSSDWRKPGYLEIIYTEADPSFWRRSFLFNDEKDNQLLSKDSTTKAKIPFSTLRKLFAGKKEVVIYTVASPVNPDIAVRIRRVHLCTLKLR